MGTGQATTDQHLGSRLELRRFGYRIGWLDLRETKDDYHAGTQGKSWISVIFQPKLRSVLFVYPGRESGRVCALLEKMLGIVIADDFVGERDAFGQHMRRHLSWVESFNRYSHGHP